MRRLNWWETPEEQEAGFTYQLIVESRDLEDGYLIDGRFLGGGCGQETIMLSEKRDNETQGIMDMMRSLFWEIKEIPELSKLHRRMWALYLADYDSARESDITDDLQACCELVRDGSFAETVNEELFNEITERLRATLLSAEEEPVFSDTRCWISGPVVIDGVLHRMEERFVKCDPSLNRRAINVSLAEAVCPVCFPEKAKEPVKVDPFYCPPTHGQMGLFGGME